MAKFIIHNEAEAMQREGKLEFVDLVQREDMQNSDDAPIILEFDYLSTSCDGVSLWKLPVAEERASFEMWLKLTVENVSADTLAIDADGIYVEEWVRLDFETYQRGRAEQRAVTADNSSQI